MAGTFTSTKPHLNMVKIDIIAVSMASMTATSATKTILAISSCLVVARINTVWFKHFKISAPYPDTFPRNFTTLCPDFYTYHISYFFLRGAVEGELHSPLWTPNHSSQKCLQLLK